MLGYCQCSFVAVVPLVSLGYVNLAPCALKFVEVAVCACTCISRSLATGDCLPTERTHFNYCRIVCIDVLVPEVGLKMSQHAGKYI